MQLAADSPVRRDDICRGHNPKYGAVETSRCDVPAGFSEKMDILKLKNPGNEPISNEAGEK
jgi:hypothetical protein